MKEGEAACGRRLSRARVGLLHHDVMHPAVAEVVPVGEAPAGALDELVEITLFVAVFPAFPGRFIASILDASDGRCRKCERRDGRNLLLAE